MVCRLFFWQDDKRQVGDRQKKKKNSQTGGPDHSVMNPKEYATQKELALQKLRLLLFSGNLSVPILI